MRYTLLLFIVLFALISKAQTPLTFTENKGQWDENVLYKADVPSGILFIERDGLTYLFSESNGHSHGDEGFDPQHPEKRDVNHENEKIRKHAVKIEFLNGFSKSSGGYEPIAGYSNYFIGNDKSKWASKVYSYNSIVLKNVYRNIDFKLYQKDNSLKYEFIVHKGGRPNDIVLKINGADSVALNKWNGLSIFTSLQTIYEKAPISFQSIQGETINIPCSFKLNKHRFVTFELADYNSSEKLVIDPELLFSTYTGSTADNWGNTATFDRYGNAFAGGIVSWSGYPVSIGAYDEFYNGGAWDIGIIKYSASGTERIFATYIGGSGTEMPHSIIANSNEELVIYGTTGSSDFPLQNPVQNIFQGGIYVDYLGIPFINGTDIYVCKLSRDGSELLGSTYLGGTSNDGLNYNGDPTYGGGPMYHNYGDGARGEVAIDREDNVYIGSCTFSNNFPTRNAMQPLSGGQMDGVVFKLTPNLNNIIYSTYLGGMQNDAVYSIDVTRNGEVFAAGGTMSNNFPTTALSYAPVFQGGSTDGFITRISNSGNRMVASSFFGSSEYDQAYFVRADKEGFPYIYGQTSAPNTTLVFNAAYSVPNSGQFVAKFKPDLDTLVWSTVFGSGSGEPTLSPTAFSVDLCNRAYLSGSGRMQPTPFQQILVGSETRAVPNWSAINGTKGFQVSANAYQSETDGLDFYFLVLPDDASYLDYATFFGELHDGGYYSFTNGYVGCPSSGRDHVDGGTSRFDRKGNIYQSVCASCGGCQGFPIKPDPGAWSSTNNADNCNNGLAKFSIHYDFVVADFDYFISPCVDLDVTFRNLSQIVGDVGVIYRWDFDGDKTDDIVSFDPDARYTFPDTGRYEVRLIVEDTSSCNLIDTLERYVDIYPYEVESLLDTIYLCAGDSVIIGIEAFADPAFVYEWTPADSVETPDSNYTMIKPSVSQSYILRARTTLCVQLFEQPVVVYPSSMELNLTTSDGNNRYCSQEEVELIATSGGIASYLEWSTATNMIPLIHSGADSTLIIHPVRSAWYYVEAWDAHCNLYEKDSIEVQVILPSISLEFEDTIICQGDNLRNIAVQFAPGQDLSFEWTSPIGEVTRPYATSTDVRDIQISGNITLTATDNLSGCFARERIYVEVDSVVLNEDVKNISCFGFTDGSISISPTGIPPMQIEFNGSSTINTTWNNLQAGVYEIFIEDSRGCLALEPYRITEPELLTMQINTDNIRCEDRCNGLLEIFPTGGTPPYYYYLDGNLMDSSYTHSVCIGNHRVELRDTNSCITSQTFNLILNERLPILNAIADPDTVIRGEEVILSANSEIDSLTSYRWLPQTYLLSDSLGITSAYPEENIVYYLIAEDIYGCYSYDEVSVVVLDYECDDPFVYIPNVFSPNGDGKNDYFSVQSQVLTNMEITIYTRWGEEVFYSDELNAVWDGTYKGEELSQAVFVYSFRGTCLDGKKLEKKGNITIIK